MGGLSKPSKELTLRILTEVGFKDRLIGYRLRERAGPMSITLYSFEEVVCLLNDPYPRIDFNQLEVWTRETMGDLELAGRIKEVVKKDISDQERLCQIRDLMEERSLQCKG